MKIVLCVVASIALAITATAMSYAEAPVSPIYFPFIAVSEPAPSGMGLAMTTGPGARRDAFFDSLRPPAYFNWVHWEEDMFQRGGTYYPTIWGHTYRRNIDGVYQETHPDLSEINRLSWKYPGHTWLLWNERTEQTAPVDAIPHTISWINSIKPFGKVACCGTSVYPPRFDEKLPRANGIKWLTSYVNLGGPIPDYWHVHIYLAENPSEWSDNMNRFLTWWEQYGQDKPIIISETAGSCTPQMTSRECIEHQKEMMQYIAEEWLPDNRIIDILWFKSHQEQTGNQHEWLLDRQGNKSELGKLWMELRSASK